MTRHREGLESDLDTLKKSYQYFKDHEDIPNREQHMSDIVKRGKWYKQQLEIIPEYPTIGSLAKKNEELCYLWLDKLVTILAASLNVGNTISLEQIEDVAYSIMDNYKTLTMEDVATCFLRIKNGGFGVLFNSIDCAKIMNFLSIYQEEIVALRLKLMDKSDESGEFGTKYIAPPKPAGDGPINEKQLMDSVKTLSQMAKDLKTEDKNPS